MQIQRRSDTDVLIEAKRVQIKTAMARLGRQLATGNEQELLYWIIPNALACAHRPLRYHPLYGGSRLPLPTQATTLITEWTELVKLAGIKSVISLWHDGDMKCYRSLPLGNGDLLSYIESQGLDIARHPYEDPAHKRTPPAQARITRERIRAAAFASYDVLQKPVLIMCSAGEDRSAPVAAYIFAKRALEA